MSAVATIARTVRIIHAPSHGICSNVTTLGHMYKTFSQRLHGETRSRECVRNRMGNPHHCPGGRRGDARRSNVHAVEEIRSTTRGSQELTDGSVRFSDGWAQISDGSRGMSDGSAQMSDGWAGKSGGSADLALAGDQIGGGGHFLQAHGAAGVQLLS